MHARNIYLIFYLNTGCISPQYHCCYDDFFETTHHGTPDVSGTVCWQQLANLDHMTAVLSEVSAPKQRSIISLEMPSEEETHTTSKPIFAPPMYNVTLDDYIISDEESYVLENSCQSQWARASHQHVGVTPVEPIVTACASQRGQVCTMSRRMA